MEYFSTGSSDKAVEEAVLKRYDFAMSYPFPEEWLAEHKNDYDFMNLNWMKELREDTTLLLQGTLDRSSQCVSLCIDADGPYMYTELLEQEQEKIEKLIAAKSYEERYVVFDALEFGRLSYKKDASV